MHDWLVADLVVETGISRSKLYTTLKTAGIDPRQGITTKDVVRALIGQGHRAEVMKLREQIKGLEIQLGEVGHLIPVKAAVEMVEQTATALTKIAGEIPDEWQRLNYLAWIERLPDKIKQSLRFVAKQAPVAEKTDEQLKTKRASDDGKVRLSIFEVEKEFGLQWPGDRKSKLKVTLVEALHAYFGWIPFLRSDKLRLETRLLRIENDLRAGSIVRFADWDRFYADAVGPMVPTVRNLPNQAYFSQRQIEVMTTIGEAFRNTVMEFNEQYLSDLA